MTRTVEEALTEFADELRRERETNYSVSEAGMLARIEGRLRALASSPPPAAAERGLRERIEALATEREAEAERFDRESEAETRNDDERRTALAKFIAAIAARDHAKALRAALREETR
jgi:hypothetical protein